MRFNTRVRNKLFKFMQPNRPATNGLAIVGFITLVFFGVVLAVYLARFVPTAVNGLASAVVTVTSVFVPADDNTIVVDEEETPSEEEKSTDEEKTTDEETTDDEEDTTTETPTPTRGDERVDVETRGGNGIVSDPNGRADLVPTILATGKLVGGTNADDFIETTNVNDNDRIAVKFVIANTGTRTSVDDWNFSVTMPTRDTYIFRSNSSHVQALNPGEHIEYVIGFDRARSGDDRPITVVVDTNDEEDEINEANNSDFVRIDIAND